MTTRLVLSDDEWWCIFSNSGRRISISAGIRPNGHVENWLALAPECVQGGAADKGYGSDALLEPYRIKPLRRPFRLVAARVEPVMGLLIKDVI